MTTHTGGVYRIRWFVDGGLGNKERQVMEEFCAYCGEEIVGDVIHHNDNAFCSQECLDAFNEEELLFTDEDERDDF